MTSASAPGMTTDTRSATRNWWELGDFPDDYDTAGALGQLFKQAGAVLALEGQEVGAYSFEKEGLCDAAIQERFLEVLATFSPTPLVEEVSHRNVKRCWAVPGGLVTANFYPTGETATLSLAAHTPALLERLREELGGLLATKDPRGRVFLISSGHGGYGLKSVGFGGATLRTENYEAEIVETFQMLVSDMRSSSPRGRLVVLEGEPGTGKTYLVRGLLAEVPSAAFIFVPQSMAADLQAPQMVPLLIDLKDDERFESVVLVIEDADGCLVPRAADNMSAISGLLNLTAGMLGDLLDLRVIATTNARRCDMDPALLRPGRLGFHIKTEALSRGRATEVYRHLTGKPRATYDGGTTLAAVYRAARE